MQGHNRFTMLLYKLPTYENLSVKLSVKTICHIMTKNYSCMTLKEVGGVCKISLAFTYIDYV